MEPVDRLDDDLMPGLLLKLGKGGGVFLEPLGDGHAHVEVGLFLPDRQLPRELPVYLHYDRVLGLYIGVAVAVRARLAQGLHQGLPDPLPGHLDNAELGYLEYVGPGLVDLQGLLEGVVDLLPVGGPRHVDEVYDDDAAYVPEAELIDGL